MSIAQHSVYTVKFVKNCCAHPLPPCVAPITEVASSTACRCARSRVSSSSRNEARASKCTPAPIDASVRCLKSLTMPPPPQHLSAVFPPQATMAQDAPRSRWMRWTTSTSHGSASRCRGSLFSGELITHWGVGNADPPEEPTQFPPLSSTQRLVPAVLQWITDADVSPICISAVIYCITAESATFLGAQRARPRLRRSYRFGIRALCK